MLQVSKERVCKNTFWKQNSKQIPLSNINVSVTFVFSMTLTKGPFALDDDDDALLSIFFVVRSEKKK